MSRVVRACAILLVLFTIVPILTEPAAAQWKPNGAPVCATIGSRGELAVIPDGSGGVFASWSDTRDQSTNQQDIYLQRVDAFGYPLWITNGIAPNAGPTVQLLSALADDGAGGVVVMWSQGSSPATLDIYAQRYDDSGNALWTPGGITVCNATDIQVEISAVADGMGGVWLAWTDYRYGPSDTDIFINRIDAAGNLTWGTTGASVCGSLGIQWALKVVSDGLGGAIIAWDDYRGGDADVYAQRIDAANIEQWAFNGILMTGAANGQNLDAMVADGSGGAILALRDYRSGSEFDIYAQRVTGAGSVLWGANGTVICEAASDQHDATLAADGAGGAVIVWSDERDGVSWDIYAQYIDPAGATRWSLNGNPVADVGSGSFAYQTSIAGMADGVAVTWADTRSGVNHPFAQRLTFDGVEMWTPNGLAITDVAHSGSTPQVVADISGGVVLAWLDTHTGRADVYAQRLEPTHGEWGRPEPYVYAADDNPGDQGGAVELEWWASDRDKQPYSLIGYYTTWRATDSPFMATSAAPEKNPGDGLSAAVRAAEETWPDATVVTNPGDIASGFDGEAVWVEQGPQGGPVFWEWMSSLNAYYQPGYSYLAPTRADSSGAGPAQHYFKVIAHTWDQYVFWESQYTSGYSVDNIAPGAPLLLMATRVGNYVRLDWNPSGLDEPDFSQYVVYRATSGGVTPVPLYLLDNTTEDTLWDQNAPPGTPYYYIVTAKDVHGNQSLPSNEANVDGAPTGVGDDVPALTSLQVMPNMPNPFGDATTLRVGLPDDGDIALEVYDVAGRRVFARTYPAAARGWRDITFDGRDSSGRALPGGVYFYRVHAAGTTVTRKMVLTR